MKKRYVYTNQDNDVIKKEWERIANGWKKIESQKDIKKVLIG